MKLMLISLIILASTIFYMSKLVYKEGMHDIKQLEVIERLESENYSTELFRDVVPKPKWFEKTTERIVRNDNDVTALWQSEKRCCEDSKDVLENRRIFYKACYNGIVKNPFDEDLVVKCLWLMGYSETKTTNPLLGKFLYENYFYHDNKIDNCVNCSKGDTVTRAVMDYAESIKINYLYRSIEMLERLLDERENDISNWIKIDLYKKLGYLYQRQDKITLRQIQRIERGIVYLDEVVKKGNEKRSVLQMYNMLEQLKKMPIDNK